MLSLCLVRVQANLKAFQVVAAAFRDLFIQLIPTKEGELKIGSLPPARATAEGNQSANSAV